MRIIRASKGTTRDMLEAMKSKLDEISSCDTVDVDIESSEAIMGDEAQDSIISQISDEVLAEVENELDDIKPLRKDGDNLVTVFKYDDKIISMEIPIADLKLDEDHIDEDVAYISNSIIEDVERSIGGYDDDEPAYADDIDWRD